jgi:hypothetical protein
MTKLTSKEMKGQERNEGTRKKKETVCALSLAWR